MVKEALEYLVGLARNGESHTLENIQLPSPVDGDSHDYAFRVSRTEYGSEIGTPVEPFRPEPLEVTTLTGFIAALDALGPAADDYLVHIKEPTTVVVKSVHADAYGKRNVLLRANYAAECAFTFDSYYDNLANFVIALQSNFVPTDELAYLIRLASSMKAGNTVQSTDDGLSQLITVKTGEVSTAEVKVNPRINLRPVRTFTEIEPEVGEFLIRFRQSGNGMPCIALFNIDGQRWRNNTMHAIKQYFNDIVTLPVIA